MEKGNFENEIQVKLKYSCNYESIGNNFIDCECFFHDYFPIMRPTNEIDQDFLDFKLRKKNVWFVPKDDKGNYDINSLPYYKWKKDSFEERHNASDPVIIYPIITGFKTRIGFRPHTSEEVIRKKIEEEIELISSMILHGLMIKVDPIAQTYGGEQIISETNPKGFFTNTDIITHEYFYPTRKQLDPNCPWGYEGFYPEDF